VSRNRMNHREENLYLLGLTLENAVDGLLDRDDQHPNWEWLVSMMEVTAKANPETAPFGPLSVSFFPTRAFRSSEPRPTNPRHPTPKRCCRDQATQSGRRGHARRLRAGGTGTRRLIFDFCHYLADGFSTVTDTAGVLA